VNAGWGSPDFGMKWRNRELEGNLAKEGFTP